MIRVLHFIPAFNMGGMESLVMSLYRNIDRQKVQFDFLVETKNNLNVFDEIKSMGGNIYRITDVNKYNPISYISKIANFFKENGEKFNILHCHNYERGPVISYYAKKYGINHRIFHAHTNSMDDVRFRQLKRILMRVNNFLSTDFLASSKESGDFYFSKDKKKFIVFKNSIDVNSFTFNKEIRIKLKKELNLSDEFVIGHTGRFTYAKNHSRIIEIFKILNKKVPNSKLLLIGDGPLREELESLVDKYSLSSSVIMTGTKDNINDYLQVMDVFLLPSFFEGFCISLLEAQASGLPCIVSKNIPKEVELTNLVEKLDLEDNNDLWVAKIEDKQSFLRINHSSSIITNGYDTKENAKKLQKFYFDTIANFR